MKSKEVDVKSFIRSSTLWLSLIAGFLLIIANSALWLNRYIFDEKNFSQIVTESLTSESSRRAIGQRINEVVLEERPIIQQTVGEVSTNIISGLLNTSAAKNAISITAQKLNLSVTSSTREPLSINLVGIKDTIAKLIDVSASLGRESRVDPNNIPDEIIILDTNKLPNFYGLGVFLLWLAPIAVISAFIALVYPYLRKANRNIKQTALIQGVSLLISGILALLIGPLLKPTILSNANSIYSRTVASNLYDAFIFKFNQQTAIIIIFGFIIIAFSIVLYLFPAIKKKIKT